jgi:hypothetical protein
MEEGHLTPRHITKAICYADVVVFDNLFTI